LGKVDLGEKLTCSSCGARYYDLKKSPAACPKCGTENERPKTFKAKKADAAPKPVKKSAAPKKSVEDGDEEDLDEDEDLDLDDISDDDDDDDLIEDDDDDDDDDVDSVIGVISSDDDKDT